MGMLIFFHSCRVILTCHLQSREETVLLSGTLETKGTQGKGEAFPFPCLRNVPTVSRWAGVRIKTKDDESQYHHFQREVGEVGTKGQVAEVCAHGDLQDYHLLSIPKSLFFFFLQKKLKGEGEPETSIFSADHLI